MSYKPHLAVLIPVALAAGRQGRALVGAGISAGALALASLMVFGHKTWQSFMQDMPVTWHSLATDTLPWEKVSSFYGAARLSGADLPFAMLLQGVVMLVCLGAVVRVWRRNYPPAWRNSLLVLAILLFTPHVFYYDLALLALPLAWLGREVCHKGAKNIDSVFLFLGWILPFLVYPFRQFSLNSFAGPAVLLGWLGLITVKAKRVSDPFPGMPGQGALKP